jgi:hypothetical protein
VTSTWQQHPAEPDTWKLHSGWGHCIAAVRLNPDDGTWEGIVRPRPGASFGFIVRGCLTRKQAMRDVTRDLLQHWPEVAP